MALLTNRAPRTKESVIALLEDDQKKEQKRTVTFQMTDSTHGKLKVHCAQTGKKMGALIEQLVIEYMDELSK
jgi:hypothetical protein